jgi:hypothetical protein
MSTAHISKCSYDSIYFVLLSIIVIVLSAPFGKYKQNVVARKNKVGMDLREMHVTGSKSYIVGMDLRVVHVTGSKSYIRNLYQRCRNFRLLAQILSLV